MHCTEVHGCGLVLIVRSCCRSVRRRQSWPHMQESVTEDNATADELAKDGADVGVEQMASAKD